MFRRAPLVLLVLACLALPACGRPTGPDPPEPKVFYDRPDTPLSARTGPAIRLSNSACMGTCPVWRVELRPDGQVIYQGGDNTAVKGERRWRIAPGQVERIAFRARQDGFFDRKSSIGGYGMDGGDTVISICHNSRCRAVRALPSEPLLMQDLYRDIVETSRVASYVTTTLETLARLDEEGFDFRSKQAGCLLARAATSNDRRVGLALVARGAPVNLRCAEGMGTAAPLWGASFSENSTLLAALIKAGAIRQTHPYDLVTLIDTLERSGRKDKAAFLRKASGLTLEKEQAIRREPPPYRSQQNN